MMHCLSVLPLKVLKSCFLNWLFTLCVGTGGRGGWGPTKTHSLDPHLWQSWLLYLRDFCLCCFSLEPQDIVGKRNVLLCTNQSSNIAIKMRWQLCVFKSDERFSWYAKDWQPDIPCFTVRCCIVLNLQVNNYVFFYCSCGCWTLVMVYILFLRKILNSIPFKSTCTDVRMNSLIIYKYIYLYYGNTFENPD